MSLCVAFVFPPFVVLVFVFCFVCPCLFVPLSPESFPSSLLKKPCVLVGSFLVNSCPLPLPPVFHLSTTKEFSRQARSTRCTPHTLCTSGKSRWTFAHGEVFFSRLKFQVVQFFGVVGLFWECLVGGGFQVVLDFVISVFGVEVVRSFCFLVVQVFIWFMFVVSLGFEAGGQVVFVMLGFRSLRFGVVSNLGLFWLLSGVVF